jgi:hypothetical protein
VPGPTKRDIKAVRLLCGNEPKDSFIVATTMWKDIDNSMVLQREDDLKTNTAFFRQFTELGVKFMRHPGSNKEQASTHEIIRALLHNTQAINVSLAIDYNESGRIRTRTHGHISSRTKISQLIRLLFGGKV